jgi:hypothetical protein
MPLINVQMAESKVEKEKMAESISTSISKDFQNTHIFTFLKLTRPLPPFACCE